MRAVSGTNELSREFRRRTSFIDLSIAYEPLPFCACIYRNGRRQQGYTFRPNLERAINAISHSVWPQPLSNALHCASRSRPTAEARDCSLSADCNSLAKFLV